jgi:hypothetical protein
LLTPLPVKHQSVFQRRPGLFHSFSGQTNGEAPQQFSSVPPHTLCLRIGLTGPEGGGYSICILGNSSRLRRVVVTKLLFECPSDFNRMGVCHASSGAWLRYSRTRAATGGVKTIADLGQPSFFKLIWDDPDDAKGIDRLNLLGKPIDVVKKQGPFTAADVAAALVRRVGEYCLISFWGDKEAHTVAAITIEDNLQSLIPTSAAGPVTIRES